MESSSVDRYTPFPDLEYGGELIPSLSTADWSCETVLTIETLAISWASVLSKFSGEEIPVFLLDGNAVKVCPKAGNIEATNIDGAESSTCKITSICTTDEFSDLHEADWEIRYYPGTQHGKIISRGCCTESYLRQIAVELERELQGRSRYSCADEDIFPHSSVVNPQPFQFAGQHLLHDMIKRTGNEAAIEFLKENGEIVPLSYQDLDLQSQGLATRLTQAFSSFPEKPQGGRIVPVLLPQSLELYVAWIAILKAGAAVCPISLDSPDDRIKFIVGDVDAQLVVTSGELASRFDSIQTILISTNENEPATLIDEDVDVPDTKPDDIAYVMYTSGSTGLPKGVCISHFAVVQALLAHEEIIPSFKRFLQFASPTFDVSVFEIFFPLFRGVTLIGCERRVMLNDLPGVINRLNVDAAELTPSVAGELLRHREATPSLNVLLTIGEMLTRHVVDEFGFSAEQPGLLHGMYGPTEATIHCTAAPNFVAGSRVGNIGRPLETVSAFIFAASSTGGDPELLAVGQIGELVVGGPQLAKYYLNRPEENQRAFIDSRPFGRLYRTGDKARLHPNGEIECLGRISTGQVKIRGQRIELGEIENVFYKVSGVRNAAVCVVMGGLVAFVSIDTDTCGLEDLQDACKKSLPKYMIPGSIVILDTLPKLASGKIARKLLEAEYIQSKGLDKSGVAEFGDDVERTIAAHVEQLLGYPVNASASLISAGLDSLKVIKLVSELRRSGLDVDVLDILETDNVRQISQRLSNDESSNNTAAPKIDESASETWKAIASAGFSAIQSIQHPSVPVEVVPCSPAQIAMLLESTLDPKAYFNWIELEFDDGISATLVKDAFRAIALQNEILRSSFVELDTVGYPYAQVILNELCDDQFTECDGFRYDLEPQNESNILRPLRIQLGFINNKLRALIHIHHALYDGWSWDLITQDLSKALQQIPLPHRPQYRLFSLFHIENLTPEMKKSAISYWESHLEGIAPSLWPSFRDRWDTEKNVRLVEHEMAIKVEDLDALARKFKLGRQTIFQAAIGYLLGAYLDVSDVTYGSVLAGRTLPIEGIQDMVGPCISTLPLRLDLKRLRSVRDLLAALHSLHRKSLVHGFLPLRDIKRAAGANLETQLFDTIFVWQDIINTSNGPITEVGSMDFLEFTLTLDIGIRENKVHAKAIFQESIIPAEQASLLLRHIEQFVLISLQTPDILLQDIGARFPESLLSVENPSYLGDTSLMDLTDAIEKVTRSDPERIAIEILEHFDLETGFETVQRLTYSGLNIRSNRLANYLLSLNVTEGDLVAICLEKSIELYIAILAVHKIGAGYAPMTPQTPPLRIQNIITTARCQICITSREVSAQLPDLPAITHVLVDNSTFEEYGPSLVSKSYAGSGPAYAVFTSGTTGVPKGVLVSRANLQSNIFVLANLYPTPLGSRFLQATSFAFDVSVFDIFFAWSTGMTLCSARNDILFRDMERVIRGLGITHLSLTPTVAGLIDSKNVPAVKFLVTAGEALTPKVLQNWAETGLWQGYGPSETTNICTVKKMTLFNFSNNLGKPLDNTSAFVISNSDEFSLVPRGAVGELCYGGMQVALGYMNMEELTQKLFINHPKYGRIYKSGDYGRLLPDGSIVFIGRRDDLVKVRGHRIELREIDSVFLKNDHVEISTTIIHKLEGSNKDQLITFWVPYQNDIQSSAQVIQSLFDHAGQNLPGYMVPSFLIPIDRIPLTVVGKVNKRELLSQLLQISHHDLDLYSRGVDLTVENEQFSETEDTVANVIAQAMNIPRADIDRQSSFYRLGLDSVMAISLSRQLRASGFGQIDVSTIMKNHSVARLAGVIKQKTQVSEPQLIDSPTFDSLFSVELIHDIKDELASARMNSVKILPCTTLQESMLSSRVDGDFTSYYNHLTFELFGNVTDFKSAWQVIIQRHEILRTWFRQTDDTRFAFVQVVLEKVDAPWEEIECTENELPSVLDETRSKGLREEGPGSLCSFTVFRCTDSPKVRLLLSIHHALYDGEAMEVLLKEVEDVLLGYQLPSVVPYGLYLDQMVRLDCGLTDQFWGAYLKDFSPSLLSPSSSMTKGQSKHFELTSQVLDIRFSEVINECKASSATILSLLQAAWGRLICFLSGASDICFGDVMNCRSIPVEGAERIVGPCFNTLPVRIQVNDNTTNSHLMQNLHSHKLEILPYQLSSLRRVQSQAGKQGSKLFDTLLLLQSSPRPLNEGLWKLVDETGDMDFPIVCEVIPNRTKDNIELNLHFDESRISASDIEIMISFYTVILRHTLYFPSARVMDFDIIDSSLTTGRSINMFRTEKLETSSQKLSGNTQQSPEQWEAEAQLVRDLLSEMSKVDKQLIQKGTTIFELGLDSINAIQISTHFRKRDYRILASDILEGPSLGSIASFLQQSKRQTPHIDAPMFDFQAFQSLHWDTVSRNITIPSSYIEAIRPCTPIQSGMLASYVNTEGDLYLNSLTMDSIAPLDTPSLKLAWTQVVERNEMLRTGFYHVRDEKYPFAMVTYRPGSVDVPWYECPESSKHGVDTPCKHQSTGIKLNEIHLPPWSLTIHSGESSTAIRFSALHALYDAHSLNLIFSEVAKLYHGLKLPEPISVSPVVSGILEYCESNDRDSEKYWAEASSQFQATKFPDMNPLHTSSERSQVLFRHCSKTLAELQAQCMALGVTIQAAGQAAWSQLLASYVGEPSVTYGLVLSGRSISADASSTVFPCLTTIPIRHDVTGSNRELLSQIMQSNTQALKFQFTPLSKIQRLSKTDSPLFDTLFVFQKLSSSSEDHELWTIGDEESKTEYPISIELIPDNTQLKLNLTFKDNILPEAQASLLLEELDWLLVNSIFSPDSISLDVISSEPQISSVFPRKFSRLPSPIQLLHEFVETKAVETPSRTALEFAERSDGDLAVKSWTYKELNEKGNEYANLLKNLGAHPGMLIGICFNKCPEAYFSILGILKLGCAYLAIDPTAPIARKQFIMEDSGATFLASMMEHKSELDEIIGVKVVVLDEPNIFDGISATAPILEVPVRPDSTCYCLYTSGSTGTPKGCEITHDNAVQAMLAFRNLFDNHWDDNSRWLQFASFHFDVSVLEQYWSWSVGICVTSCPRDTLFEDFSGTIRDLEITHIDLTPSLAQLLHPDDVPSLCRGIFITGGEQLKQTILDAWGKFGVIYNGYGPTEVTIGCTMLPRVGSSDKPSNIGPQFDNVSSYVFKPNTDIPVLRGGIGELCVSGPLVGRGYLRRPELTAEKFRYNELYGERVYRTGDLVRQFHDGSYCFLGRIDDQVKLRGQRLEINEINHVIKNATEDVAEVVSMVLKHPTASREQIVSFITVHSSQPENAEVNVNFDDGIAPTIEEVRRNCHLHLPGYMVPTHIVPLTRYPLSSNNKIDNRQLKEIYGCMSLNDMQLLSSRASEESTNTTEVFRAIVPILSKITKASENEISPLSNIFELGLDSISAISFSRLLREAGYSNARPSVVMKCPTVSMLAKTIQKSDDSISTSDQRFQDAKQRVIAFAHMHSPHLANQLKIPLDAIEAISPCTPLQDGMLYKCLESESRPYLSCFSFELHPNIDISRLKRSWEHAQTTIQLLRAKFPLTDDGHALVVLKQDTFPWVELMTDSDDEVGHVSQTHYQAWKSGFEGFNGRIWEAGVISGPTRQLMILNIFHGLYDGNSLPLLLSAVSSDYHGQKVPITSSFTDVLPLGPLLSPPDAKSFWTDHLEDASIQKLPEIQTEDLQPIISKLNLKLPGVESLRRRLNVTEQALFHACWLHAFERCFTFVPTMGIVVSGRAFDADNVETIIGPLFNTLPCNIMKSPFSSFAELVQTCHNYAVSVIPFQHTPLRSIMKWTGRNAESPIFNTLFVFQRNIQEELAPTDALWAESTSYAEADYPLALEVQSDGKESFVMTLVSQSNILSQDGLNSLLSQFESSLDLLIREPSTILSFSGNPSQSTLASTNGETATTLPDTVNGAAKFEWSEVSLAIRLEIAKLAGLDTSSIMEESSFLEVGLDSIDAIKLSSRLSRASIDLPVSKIMRHRTIKSMMTAIVSNNASSRSPVLSLSTIEKQLRQSVEADGCDLSGIDNVLPATPLQEGMLSEMMQSDFHHYFNHDILELEDDVDIELLRAAWAMTISSNPILRTSFVPVSNPSLPFSFAQLVHNHTVEMNWGVEDITGKPIELVLDKQRLQAMQQPIILPLLSLRILLDGDKRVLLFSLPHAMYDGWSLHLIHQDVTRYYAGQTPSHPSYQKILRHILSSTGDEGLHYWRGALAGAVPSVFPLRYDAGQDNSIIHRKEIVSSVPRSEAIKFCMAHGVTAQTLGLSCWAIVLSQYLKQLDVVFGTVILGRDIKDATDVVFPTMNTIPIRGIIHGTCSDMLEFIQQELGNTIEHQHYPLRKIKAMTGIGNKSLFDTLFIYQKAPDSPQSPSRPLYNSIQSSSAVEYSVCVEMEIVDDSVVWRVACSDTVLGEKDMNDLVGSLLQTFQSVIQEPGKPAIKFDSSNKLARSLPVSPSNGSTLVQNGLTPTPVIPETLSPLERKIRTVLSLVSGVPEEEISRSTTIFNLGIDSITAIKASSLLRKESVKLSVRDILRAETVENMASIAGSPRLDKQTNGYKSIPVSIETPTDANARLFLQTNGFDEQNIDSCYPATAGQMYMLETWKSSGGRLFFPGFFYKMEGNVSSSQLDDAWRKLIDTIPILRTVFLPTAGNNAPYVQVVLKNVENPIIWRPNLRWATCRRHSTTQRGSGLVYLYASQTESETLLMLHIHHALYDAVVLQQIINVFERFCLNLEAPIHSNLNIADVISFYNTNSSLQQQQVFWTKYLGPAKPEALNGYGSDGSYGIVGQYRPSLINNTASLSKICRAQGLTVQSVFMAMYAKVHVKIFRPPTANFIFGVYLANRSHSMTGIEDCVVPTLNILPLLIESPAERPIFEIAQNIQNDLREISHVQNCNVSLAQIAEWTGVKLDITINFLSIPDVAQATNGTAHHDEPRLIPLSEEVFSSPQDGEKCNGETNGETNGESHGLTCEQRLLATYKELETVSLGHVFKPSIDLEAAIRNNHLDVGIFGTENKIDNDAALKILEEIRCDIMSLGKEAEQIGKNI